MITVKNAVLVGYNLKIAVKCVWGRGRTSLMGKGNFFRWEAMSKFLTDGRDFPPIPPYPPSPPHPP